MHDCYGWASAQYSLHKCYSTYFHHIRWTVTKEGMSKGRVFYACSKPKGDCCGYFKFPRRLRVCWYSWLEYVGKKATSPLLKHLGGGVQPLQSLCFMFISATCTRHSCICKEVHSKLCRDYHLDDYSLHQTRYIFTPTVLSHTAGWLPIPKLQMKSWNLARQANHRKGEIQGLLHLQLWRKQSLKKRNP